MLTPAATVAQTFIRNQPWHASLTPGQQARLMEQLTFVKGEKGDCLLPAGATVKGWYAVLDGLVKLQSTSAEGRVSAFLGVPAGEWFGEGSALKAEPRRYDVVALRDTTLPYPLTLDGTVGPTGVHLNGTVTGLLTLTAVDMQMTVRGDSLEQLYPLLGIALPATRSYGTQGHLLHTGSIWRYQDFTGRMGTSDIAGFVQVITGGKRPALSADLHSELFVLDDLGPVIGVRPDKLGTTVTLPAANPWVLPDLPFNTERWSSVDADVALRAGKLRSNKTLPLDKLAVHLHLSDSVLTLDPISFGLAGGQLNARITLDGRSQPIQAKAQVRARKMSGVVAIEMARFVLVEAERHGADMVAVAAAHADLVVVSQEDERRRRGPEPG